MDIRPKRAPEGPPAGLTVAVKDVFDVAGGLLEIMVEQCMLHVQLDASRFACAGACCTHTVQEWQPAVADCQKAYVTTVVV